MVEVYVWYEVPASREPEVLSAFRSTVSLMDAGAADRPIAARLMKRSATVMRKDGLRQTWMEVWPDVPTGGLEAWQQRLDQAAQRSGAAALAPDGRQVEVFEAQRPEPRSLSAR